MTIAKDEEGVIGWTYDRSDWQIDATPKLALFVYNILSNT